MTPTAIRKARTVGAVALTGSPRSLSSAHIAPNTIVATTDTARPTYKRKLSQLVISPTTCSGGRHGVDGGPAAKNTKATPLEEGAHNTDGATNKHRTNPDT